MRPRLPENIYVDYLAGYVAGITNTTTRRTITETERLIAYALGVHDSISEERFRTPPKVCQDLIVLTRALDPASGHQQIEVKNYQLYLKTYAHHNIKDRNIAITVDQTHDQNAALALTIALCNKSLLDLPSLYQEINRVQ